jgi:hypothetical protein
MTQIRNIDVSKLLKDNPVGIDKPIQKLQISLGDKIPWLDKSFGRAYRNEDMQRGKYLPEIFIGNNEYIDVFPDDLTALCFFDVDEGTTSELDNQLYQNTVRIVFSLDLEKAFPNLDYRADEEAVFDVINFIQSYSSRWRDIKAIKGVTNVYKRYNWDLPEALIDMQGYFVFAIEATVTYDYLKSCNC